MLYSARDTMIRVSTWHLVIAAQLHMPWRQLYGARQHKQRPYSHPYGFRCRVFGTASYYVQKLFSEFQGVSYIDTTVTTPEHDPQDHGIAASATCQDEDCTQIAFKVSLHMPSQAYTA